LNNHYRPNSTLDVFMPLFAAFITRVLVFTGLMVLVAACGSSAATPTFTPVPAMSAPAETAAATATPVPDTPEARGEVLFKTYFQEAGFACATCHYTSSEKRLIGPGMQNLATRMADYGLALSAEEYIRASIQSPRDFIAPGEPAYAPNAMPAKYNEILTAEQINDLVAYILSL
jgi:mono/diheme cytochrome c family protein